MKVEADYVPSNKNIESSSVSYHPSQVEKSEQRNEYATKISQAVSNQSAYKGKGKTMEEVVREASQMSAAARKDYMTVMSNSMSPEDFAKLEEEGFPIGTVEAEQIVTVLDKIKAQLVEAGVEIRGYTDNLSSDKLEEITGSTIRATVIASRMKEYDLPDTQTNQKELEKALEKALSLKELTEGTMKYMVEQEVEPTIENIYKAEYSAATDPNRQGKGYFSEGMQGYYGKKAEEYHWEELQPQIDKVIQEAGLEESVTAQDSAKWLIEKGIPLTTESLARLEDLKNLTLPQEEEKIIDSIVKAMANGQKAEDANLVEQSYFLKEAVETKESVAKIDEYAVHRVIKENRRLTIQNLWKAQTGAEKGVVGEENTGEAGTPLTDKEISARRQLEEIRLSMSVEANLKLLKRGFSIQTTELEELVNELKKMEEKTGNALCEDSIQKAKELQQMPIGVIGKLLVFPRDITLNQIHAEGSKLKTQYEAAEKTYEAVMTAPRKDLGDNIQKAFRNVDAILEDNQLETTEANQRAVRILGYNSMEITQENIVRIKEADLSLQRVLKKMTPHHTMELIKKGINPLETGFDTLEKTLETISAEGKNETDQYAKFLYKLEKTHEITEEEKEAYIGIYRLMRQIEKSDGAVIGSLVNQGADINFKNLLGAVRTNRQKGMNQVVDDTTGTLEQVTNRENTISQQITNYYNKLSQEIADELEPEKLATLQITPELNLEQVANMLRQTGEVQEVQDSYLEEQMQDFRKSEKVDKEVIQMLLDYNQPITIENLLAADASLHARGDMYRQIDEYYKKSDKTVSEGSFLNNVDAIADSLTEKETANTAYEQMKQAVQQLVDLSVETGNMGAKDMKALSLLYKQVSFTRNMAKEENYEVPITLDGEITSVNLKILHHQEETGKVSATMQTKRYGKVAAEFSLQNETVTGYIAASEEEGLASLKEVEAVFAKHLEENGLNKGALSFVKSQQLNLETFGQKETAQTQQASTKNLYFIAKSLIFALQNK